MNKLINMAYDFNQTRGRKVQVSRDKSHIRYIAPNGIEFKIYPGDFPYGNPVAYSPAAEPYGASHETHTLGSGKVCLGESMGGWDLTKILFFCDSWARGIRIYEDGYEFPSSPKVSFNRNLWKNRNRSFFNLF